MKRSLTLLLASLLLVFSLTACGGDGKQDTAQNGSAVTNNGQSNQTDQNDSQNNTGSSNGSTNGTTNGSTNNDSVMDDVGNAVTDGVDDVIDGIEDAGDAITGDNAAKSGIANRTRSTANGLF